MAFPRYIAPAAAVSAGLLLAASATAPAAASAPKPLPCIASVSVPKPADSSTEVVIVQAVKGAKVVTVAHYKTTSHTQRITANSHGVTGLAYEISRATPGFRVQVTVTDKLGARTGSCSTSFTPKR